MPVRFGRLADAAEGDAVLLEGNAGRPEYPSERFGPASSEHAPDCACCVARSPAALALGRLFQRRARGEIAFFRRVLAVTATPEGELQVWSALRTDPVASARFRLDASAS